MLSAVTRRSGLFLAKIDPGSHQTVDNAGKGCFLEGELVLLGSFSPF